jgi:putative peptidoglycan lipid II flippase
VRAYYAMQDTKTPVLVGAAAMTLSIGLSLVFAPLFQSFGWMPHGGLALAVSVATTLEVTILFQIMRLRLKGIHGPIIARGVAVSALGSVGLIAVLLIWKQVAGSDHPALTTLGGVVFGSMVYAFVLFTLRIPEVGSLLQMIKRFQLR